MLLRGKLMSIKRLNSLVPKNGDEETWPFCLDVLGLNIMCLEPCDHVVCYMCIL